MIDSKAMTTRKPLTWQKLRALLAREGTLDYGWRVGTKQDSRAVAIVYFNKEGKPGKRAVTSLTSALSDSGIRYEPKDDRSYTIRAQSVRG